jgi:hypothetical protein
MSELPTIPEATFYHGPHDEEYSCETLGEYLEELFNCPDDEVPESVEVVCSSRKKNVVLAVDFDSFVEDIENEWCGPDGGGDPEGVDFSDLKVLIEKAVAKFLKKQKVWQCETVGTVTLTAEQCRQIMNVGVP